MARGPTKAGIGIKLTGDVADLEISGTNSEIGGVLVPARDATQGLLLDPLTGTLTAPVATDLLAGAILEPPTDGKSYVRQDAKWVETTAATPYVWGVGIDENTTTPGTIDLQPATDLVIGGMMEPPADPTIQYARKNDTTTGVAWVPVVAGQMTIADAPPANPTAGMQWWDSDSGKHYTYFTDADSSQWVQISGGGGGTFTFTSPIVDDAPADTKTYGRKDNAWSEVTTAAGGGVPEAPNDGQAYARQSLAWAVVPPGTFVDAPVDTKLYGRKDAAWNEVTAFVDAPVDTKLYGRKDATWTEVTTTGGAIVPVADAFPASPVQGQLHFLGTDASLYCYFIDASSVGSWVEVSAP